MTQFAFLETEFPALFEHARKAEKAALSDPRQACFWARLTLETAVKWMFASDPALPRIYNDNLAAMLAEPGLSALTGPAIVAKAQIIREWGNRAAHPGVKPIDDRAAIVALRELFHICYWIARTYAKGAKPAPALQFDPARLERTLTITATTVNEIKAMSERFAEAKKRAEAAEQARRQTEEGRAELETEIARLRAEVAAARRENQRIPDPHDYDEAGTRDRYIDLLLHEAGWSLDQPRDREFPVTGMPNDSGQGRADYVLWGADGKPLAVIEAKRTKKDAIIGQQQAKLYADCLEQTYGRRPLIFCTNGYDHWFWDDLTYPPRPVSGFFKRDELELLIQRRDTVRPLAQVPVDRGIVERPYQTRAIRRVGEVFEKHRMRRALLVMATGSGKTRTVIALIDQLMRANRVRRVLFLADRVALVKQAHNAFKTHLPATPVANLLDRHDLRRNDQQGARVLLSTYPTMMGLIEDLADGQRRFGPGHFDLIVIDEAHRSIYRKYRAIFDYFDAMLVGLTATPRDDIDRDTYALFQLERGVPTDAYDLNDAIGDGFLVPPKAVSVPLKFQRDGISYDALTPEEQQEWDALEWGEDGETPDHVDASDLNKWLFNIDTVDKVLAQLMTQGLRIAGGDRIGKTIIFAKSSKHAQFIVDRFNANYPHLAGHFARQIDYSTPYAQTLIDDFSDPDRGPHIAVSVDMLDTGIDVPDVVNLVFFKPVRSKTKFWQMVGRGTRLRRDLFGLGQDKTEFLIFDYCQNLEFFAANPDRAEPGLAAPIGERLFRARVDLLAELGDYPALRAHVTDRLFDEVAGMNADNVIVRPHRRAVERFQDRANWADLTLDARVTLVEQIAGLPSAFRDDNLPAKQFDLLILSAQLFLLRGDAAFARAQSRIRDVASSLENLGNVPLVAQHMALILDMQTDGWWQDITPDLLDDARLRLRMLTELIEPKTRQIVITDFEDDIGTGQVVDMPELGSGLDRARFKMQVRRFIDEHRDHITLLKLHRGEQLTAQDVAELERILLENGVADPDIIAATQADGGMGRFLRSLTGLDRRAAKRAFGDFLASRDLTADQIEFIDLILDSLTENGLIDPKLFYESPFTDIDDMGIAGVFSTDDAQQVISIVRHLNSTANAA
ncbi:DEAD/DEAH box helicase family protein [Paracoccus sp. (in: a-proteobacteria)]|uniref:DEAD/DEAH box helicase family protein n=1 Tax=Paracoccus sp. TaxID=267 RepID=UPI0026E0837E|nr:DEAD/DEAH box helicase family protein [Paracoccus sp. (in: a-proteobacteria)]MDO5647515.1 DEAD/DEAH box helicase family protein [Paracoccus sp. (in: a-proteobacteria)]